MYQGSGSVKNIGSCFCDEDWVGLELVTNFKLDTTGVESFCGNFMAFQGISFIQILQMCCITILI